MQTILISKHLSRKEQTKGEDKVDISGDTSKCLQACTSAKCFVEKDKDSKIQKVLELKDKDSKRSWKGHRRKMVSTKWCSVQRTSEDFKKTVDKLLLQDVSCLQSTC